MPHPTAFAARRQIVHTQAVYASVARDIPAFRHQLNDTIQSGLERALCLLKCYYVF